MRAQRRLLVVAAVVLALALTQTAHATMEERGEELFREGVRLANEGDYDSALEYFERTMAYTPRLNVLWNIACCHVVLGKRDLAVACLDRYMEHDLAFQRSAEMQAVVAAIAAEPPDMPDLDRRGELWNRVEAASRAVGEGRATPATVEQRRYGVGNRGVQVKTMDTSSTPEGQRALYLTGRVYELASRGHLEEALPLAERTLAYRVRPNPYYNIAGIHLMMGHRDLALAFLDRYQQLLPPLRESAEFQDLMADIADAPPAIDYRTAARLYDRLDPVIERAIPPTPTPSARPPVRTEIGDEN
ncbi:MAG TPA: hypothetical protein PLS95_11135 [Thermoanaerobaculales bacterium]|nr:hypothetical protein [Thermoanaerobaculales bacterium]HQN96932.1 hypothetical protein [Thermoanaerobaculales bacterium]